MSQTHLVTIRDKIPETTECLSLQLAIAEPDRKSFAFASGQHIGIKAAIAGKDINRHYSISGFSGSCQAPEMLQITIKKHHDGLYSPFAHQLQIGEQLSVTAPQGQFTLPPPAESTACSYAAIVGGIGMTPIISIIEHTLMSNPQSRFCLIYSSRYKAGTLFRERLEFLKNRFMTRFNPIFITSREEQDFPLFSGRLDEEKLASLMNNLMPAEQTTKLLISAPEGLAALVKAQAQKIGYGKTQIMQERFGSTKAKNPQQQTTDTAQDGIISRIKITHNGHSSELPYHEAEGSILDVALKAGLDLPHSCKAGVCASCLAHLSQGDVQMGSCEGLGAYEAEKGYILCCQAIPQSDSVHIDFDR